jgi:murein DD-endopeptidase MepM/ murein hydrolase activator NlpD
MSFVLTNPRTRATYILFSFVIPLFLSAILLCLTPISFAQDAPSGLSIHVVQRGENLFQIAQLYGTTIDELVRLNGLSDPGSLQIGDRLLVPVVGGTAVSVAPSVSLGSEVFHVVLPGETLFQIATQYGATVNAVVEANSISDASLIFAGQQLLIPGVQPPQLLAETPPVVSGLVVQPQVFMTGRTGMIRLTTTVPASISGTLLGLTLPDGTDAARLSHSLIFGIPLDAPIGMTSLLISIDDGSGNPATVALNVQVIAGVYPTEALTIPEDRLELLATTVDSAEAETIRVAMSGRTEERLFTGLMGLPAAAGVTSPFGSTRSFNGGVLQRLHLGTDFGGAPGTPIFAPSDGIVVFSGPLEVRGLATILDHGWGVYTGYWHQTESYVAPGDRVVTGQVIGTIGMSGRSTGPHLHWEMWVNGVPVDPMQWVQQSFAP